jgi:Sap, sulfolipid-1-addressing protein
VLAQAAGLALLAALSPTALLVAAVYLGSSSPRKAAFYYLIGALLVSALVAVLVLLLLHAGGLDHPSQREPRYGVRLGLGVLALAAAAFAARRRRHREAPGAARKQGGGLVERLMTRPAPGTAFMAGLLIFGPSVTFIAAIQVIATAAASDPTKALAVVLVVVINVAFVWLPLAFFLAAPEATARRLGEFNGWLRAHGHVLLVGALAIAGLILVINGAAGLAS